MRQTANKAAIGTIPVAALLDFVTRDMMLDFF
jgi:hypothetical protein